MRNVVWLFLCEMSANLPSVHVGRLQWQNVSIMAKYWSAPKSRLNLWRNMVFHPVVPTRYAVPKRPLVVKNEINLAIQIRLVHVVRNRQDHDVVADEVRIVNFRRKPSLDNPIIVASRHHAIYPILGVLQDDRDQFSNPGIAIRLVSPVVSPLNPERFRHMPIQSLWFTITGVLPFIRELNPIIGGCQETAKYKYIGVSRSIARATVIDKTMQDHDTPSLPNSIRESADEAAYIFACPTRS